MPNMFSLNNVFNLTNTFNCELFMRPVMAFSEMAETVLENKEYLFRSLKEDSINETTIKLFIEHISNYDSMFHFFNNKSDKGGAANVEFVKAKELFCQEKDSAINEFIEEGLKFSSSLFLMLSWIRCFQAFFKNVVSAREKMKDDLLEEMQCFSKDPNLETFLQDVQTCYYPSTGGSGQVLQQEGSGTSLLPTMRHQTAPGDEEETNVAEQSLTVARQHMLQNLANQVQQLSQMIFSQQQQQPSEKSKKSKKKVQVLLSEEEVFVKKIKKRKLVSAPPQDPEAPKKRKKSSKSHKKVTSVPKNKKKNQNS